MKTLWLLLTFALVVTVAISCVSSNITTMPTTPGTYVKGKDGWVAVSGNKILPTTPDQFNSLAIKVDLSKGEIWYCHVFSASEDKSSDSKFKMASLNVYLASEDRRSIMWSSPATQDGKVVDKSTSDYILIGFTNLDLSYANSIVDVGNKDNPELRICLTEFGM